jgi:hypothetical protein
LFDGPDLLDRKFMGRRVGQDLRRRSVRTESDQPRAAPNPNFAVLALVECADPPRCLGENVFERQYPRWFGCGVDAHKAETASPQAAVSIDHERAGPLPGKRDVNGINLSGGPAPKEGSQGGHPEVAKRVFH